MRTVKWIAGVLLAYGMLVVAFESLAVYMGYRQAVDGIAADEDWLVLHTVQPAAHSGTNDAMAFDTVVAGVDLEGRLYVAANHWPRGWFDRAMANPDIEVTRAGLRAPFRAVPAEGTELARIRAAYTLPLVVRLLTGFPPRAFLRLDPR